MKNGTRKSRTCRRFFVGCQGRKGTWICAEKAAQIRESPAFADLQKRNALCTIHEYPLFYPMFNLSVIFSDIPIGDCPIQFLFVHVWCWGIVFDNNESLGMWDMLAKIYNGPFDTWISISIARNLKKPHFNAFQPQVVIWWSLYLLNQDLPAEKQSRGFSPARRSSQIWWVRIHPFWAPCWRSTRRRSFDSCEISRSWVTKMFCFLLRQTRQATGCRD